MWLLRAFCATALLLLVVGGSPASAQGCGPTNPNCIVPTAPLGTNNNQAASTAFVDAAVAASTSGFYTGLSGDCTATSLGVITCTKTNGVIFYTGLPSPVNPADAATKAYVDSSVSAGLTPHPSVILGTATALATNTYNNGTSGVGATLTATANGALSIDGSAVTSSERVLIKSESTAANNGIYVVTQTGSAGTPYILTRASDANTPGTGNPNEIGFGTYVLVTSGTANAATGWSVSSTVSTIGTSAINWTQFSAGSGVASIGGITGTGLCGIGVDCSSVAQTISSQGPVYYNVNLYGADPTCTSDSTTAFQNAWNAAKATGGFGIVYVPPVASGGCYKVSKINGVNASGVTVMGNGDKSLITITGDDSSGNWWDLSGSRSIAFKNLKITSSSNPGIAFLWACTGTSCVTSGVLSGLSFSRVNIAIGTTTAFLYGYGYGPVAGAQGNAGNGGGSLSVSNSTWTQLHNGTSTCTYASPSTCNSIVHLTGGNDLAVTSANGVTIGTGPAVAWRTVFNNFDIVDFPSGFGNGTQDNNAAVVFNNIGQLTMTGGSIQCVCVPDEVVWNNSEGVTHIQTAFEASDGSANTTKWWVLMGGGDNAVLAYQSVLFSAPTGGFIAIGPGTSATVGGVQYLTVSTPDVGLNTNNAAFITTIDGSGGATACGSFVSSNIWIARSHIEFTAGTGSSEIVGCGGIDSQTFLQGIGTNIFLASGATDHGTSNPFR